MPISEYAAKLAKSNRYWYLDSAKKDAEIAALEASRVLGFRDMGVKIRDAEDKYELLKRQCKHFLDRTVTFPQFPVTLRTLVQMVPDYAGLGELLEIRVEPQRATYRIARADVAALQCLPEPLLGVVEESLAGAIAREIVTQIRGQLNAIEYNGSKCGYALPG